MTTPMKALTVSTTASLIAVAAVTASGASTPWLAGLWTAWALLAATTIALIAAERRHTG
ncbi:hypothetical protein [Streptomyces sp. SPB074]|uniref:hypothetical protein n=1 Tax=Streptomyces sp. (strain SPB074) TaxID=465543 RepID=UPI00017F103A|nr:hypothetical protein [Streptomyces sp. SPB074]